jgi:hypothetical protein
MLSSVASPAQQHFYNLSQKRQYFRGKKFLNIKCVVTFSVQILPERFVIVRRGEREIIKNAYWSRCKVPFFLSNFNEIIKLIFSTHFRKILKYQIS